MLGRCVGASAIVARDRIQIGADRLPVDVNHRNSALDEGADIRWPRTGGRQDESIDSSPQECAHRAGFAERIIVEARREDRDIALQGGVLDRPMDGPVERIVDAADEESQRVGASRPPGGGFPPADSRGNQAPAPRPTLATQFPPRRSARC